MKFDGHEIYRINRNWIFDLTEFTGYRTKTNKKSKLLEYTKAFKIRDNKHNCNFQYTKYIDAIPVGIMRKSEEVIKAYYKEALICEPDN